LTPDESVGAPSLIVEETVGASTFIALASIVTIGSSPSRSILVQTMRGFFHLSCYSCFCVRRFIFAPFFDRHVQIFLSDGFYPAKVGIAETERSWGLRYRQNHGSDKFRWHLGYRIENRVYSCVGAAGLEQELQGRLYFFPSLFFNDEFLETKRLLKADAASYRRAKLGELPSCFWVLFF